jgi:hypothetical protein
VVVVSASAIAGALAYRLAQQIPPCSGEPSRPPHPHPLPSVTSSVVRPFLSLASSLAPWILQELHDLIRTLPSSALETWVG